MNTYGQLIRVTIFGESHGPGIGVVVDGLPAGESVDLGAVRVQMRRRAPGGGDLTTSRKETDEPLILSGLYHNKTTGSPLTAIFKNSDQHSSDYHPETPRPSHADYTAAVKFRGSMDLRGGGPFSGRLTACMVFAGAVCRQILERRGVSIAARAVQVGQAKGDEMSIRKLTDETLEQVNGGYVFRPSNNPRKWEIISDINGSVMDTITGGQDDAVARAKQLGQRQEELNWTQLTNLRKYGPIVIIGG